MKDIFILLLQKKFSGEITPAESEQLETWLRESPEHTREAAHYERIWQQAADYDWPSEPDLDTDFAALQARIRAEAPPLVVVHTSRWPALAWRAAAAVAFLLLGYGSWQYLQAPAPAAALLEKNNATTDKTLLTLSDGSRIWLRPGARVRYPAVFAAGKRDVALDGEAYFEVNHQPEHPFRVQLTGGQQVEVLGTEFNVNTGASDRPVSVLVRKGKVRFSTGATGPESVVLTAGQKAVCAPGQPSVQVSVPESMNELAWQTGRLEFIRTPLSKALADIETHHGVRVELRNTNLRNCLYTSVLNVAPPEQVLHTLARVFDMDLQQTGDKTYVLSGGRCH